MARDQGSRGEGRQGTPRGSAGEGLGSRIFALGAYLGEVIRRDRGGTWHGHDSDPQAEINVAVDLADCNRICPVQRVMQRLRNGPEDNVAHYAVLLGVDLARRTELRMRPPFPG